MQKKKDRLWLARVMLLDHRCNNIAFFSSPSLLLQRSEGVFLHEFVFINHSRWCEIGEFSRRVYSICSSSVPPFQYVMAMRDFDRESGHVALSFGHWCSFAWLFAVVDFCDWFAERDHKISWWKRREDETLKGVRLYLSDVRSIFGSCFQERTVPFLRQCLTCFRRYHSFAL